MHCSPSQREGVHHAALNRRNHMRTAAKKRAAVLTVPSVKENHGQIREH